MDLIHTITINPDMSLTHALWAREAFEDMHANQILLQPSRLSFSPWMVSAIYGSNTDLGDNLVIKSSFLLTFSLIIVDDMEKKPLLSGQSETRGLLLLGEILNSIVEALTVFGFSAYRLSLDQRKNALVIEFVVPEGLKTYTCVGGALGLIAVIDALLFARGLKFTDSHVTMAEGADCLEFMKIFNLFKHILTGL